MFTYEELVDAINQLEGGKHTIQNCEKLASIYTVLDHLYGMPINSGYSSASKVDDEIKKYGNSRFLSGIEGKSPKDVFLIVDELTEALSVIEPRLLASFYEKLNI